MDTNKLVSTAVLVNRIFGDGKRLIRITPFATRPNYYIVRIDSSEPTEEQESEFIDTVLLEQIADEFGERTDDGEGDEFPALNASCGWCWDFVSELVGELQDPEPGSIWPFVCDICGEPIKDHDWHSYHESSCPNFMRDGDFVECDCDGAAHIDCCPECKAEIDAELERIDENALAENTTK